MRRRTSSWPTIAILVLLAAGGLVIGWLVGRPREESSTDRPEPKVDLTVASAAHTGPTASVVQLDFSGTESVSKTLPRFVDVTARHGIEFSYYRGETGDFWLPETMGGGVAWVDYDGDGRLDLFFMQGCQLPEDKSGQRAAVLY